jgi:hypothetical protein
MDHSLILFFKLLIIGISVFRHNYINPSFINFFIPLFFDLRKVSFLAQLPELENLQFLQLVLEVLIVGSRDELALEVVDLVFGAEDGSGKIG